MKYILLGELGKIVSRFFEKKIEVIDVSAIYSNAIDNNDSLVLISDNIHMGILKHLVEVGFQGKLKCCFLTSRGIFSTSWLSNKAPCINCFLRRWMANLSFWEHSPEAEHNLQLIKDFDPSIRSFSVPNTLGNIASVVALVESIQAPFTNECIYIDAITASTSIGHLFPLENCNICTLGGLNCRRRYLSGLMDSLNNI